MKKVILCFTMLIFLVGCGEKKVDSSSEESFKKSMETMASSLSEEKRKELKEAIEAIAYSEIGNRFLAAADPKGARSKVREKLSGMTVDEIIAEGNQIIAEQK